LYIIILYIPRGFHIDRHRLKGLLSEACLETTRLFDPTMVYFPAVQAVLNSSEPIPDPDPIPPSGIASSISSSDGHVNTSTRAQAQAGPGPSTTTNSARFAPVHVSMSGTMAPPQGPIRKQNIACDACRSRKIRCQRVSIYQIVRYP
jgi:hypothetical protein